MPPPPVDGGPAGTAGAGVVVCGDAAASGGVVCGDAGGVVCGDAAASGGVVCGDAAASGGVVCGDAAASGGFVEVCVGVAGWVVPGEPAGDVPAGLVPAGAVGLAGPLEVVHAKTETETTTVKVAQAAK